MATTGEKILMLGLATGLVGVATYNRVWQETRNEQGRVTGIELIDDSAAASNTSTEGAPVSVTVLDPTNKTQIKQSLIQLAAQDPWCSSSYLAVKASDIAPTSNEDTRLTQQSDAVVNVQVCLDPQTIDVRDGYLMAFFDTNPKLQTGEGHPSVYLTYEQDVLLPQCKTAKEEMRMQLQQDITTVLGEVAARQFQTELHVSKDYMGHPCDDYFIEP